MVAGPVLPMLTAAEASTGVVTDRLLFPELLSGVPPMLVAAAVSVMLDMLVGPAAPEPAWTTTWKTALSPLARVLMLQVTVPPVPDCGAVQLNVGPMSWVTVGGTGEVSGGSVSVSWTPWASLGPALLTVTV